MNSVEQLLSHDLLAGVLREGQREEARLGRGQEVVGTLQRRRLLQDHVRDTTPSDVNDTSGPRTHRRTKETTTKKKTKKKRRKKSKERRPTRTGAGTQAHTRVLQGANHTRAHPNRETHHVSPNDDKPAA
jgi:hypothetical protein